MVFPMNEACAPIAQTMATVTFSNCWSSCSCARSNSTSRSDAWKMCFHVENVIIAPHACHVAFFPITDHSEIQRIFEFVRALIHFPTHATDWVGCVWLHLVNN